MVHSPWAKTLRHIVPLACLGLTFSTPAFAQGEGQEHEFAEEEVTTNRAVSDDTTVSFTVPTVEQANQKLRVVPGMTTLITEDEYRQGQAASIADILNNSPSVYIQSRYGGSETRVSVRGSGIRQTYNAIGVCMLRNGIPLSEADTNVRPQLINPLDIQYAEVLPGANGLIYGSATLGGAINFVTPTGHTADRLRMRSVIGSAGTHQTQASTGQVMGNQDFFLSGTVLDVDGFRTHSEETLKSLYGNWGIKLNDTWEARLHYTNLDSDLQLPGSLTKAQLEADPTQGSGLWVNAGAKREFDAERLDAQATAHMEDSRIDFSISAQDLEMTHPLPFPFPYSLTRSTRQDVTASARYERKSDSNELYAGLFYATGDDDSVRYDGAGAINRQRERESTTATLYVEDRFRVSDDLRLVGGAALIEATRKQTTISGFGFDGKENYSHVAPKVGFIWDTGENNQVFGNVSQSFEPPTDGNVASSIGSLDAQSALTVELGTRGSTESGNTEWIGAIYYSTVDDELLTFEEPVGSGNHEVLNADDTIHAGLELGASHALPVGDNSVTLGGTLTFNMFEFDGDDQWGDNDIPGIPHEVLRTDVVFNHHRGYWFGLNAEYASDWYVDFANSWEADSFLVFGATAGYDSGKNWVAFIEARNLTDEVYASNTGIADDAGGADTNVFNPGAVFGVFAGLEISF